MQNFCFENCIDELAEKTLLPMMVGQSYFFSPKIHRILLSVRPIVASIGSPVNFLLSTFVTQTETNAYGNLLHIKSKTHNFNFL